MQTVQKSNSSIVTTTLNLLAAVSLIGIVYCLWVLSHGGLWIAASSVTLYLVWFAIAFLSVIVMKKGDMWGAYALATATLMVGLFDLVQGVATLGGAMLGAVVFTILAFYARNTLQTHQTNDDNQHGPLINTN